jgi:predicted MFS family arabinose efflux permease
MTTLQYISNIVQSQTRTTAMTVFTAAAGGIGGFLGNIGGGFLLQWTSVFNLFKIMAGLCMVSLLIGLLLKQIDRKSI